MKEARWTVTETDGQLSISDRDERFSFEIICQLRRGKVASYPSKAERRMFAEHVAAALNLAEPSPWTGLR